MRIADMPADERPLSRLSRHGLASLSDAETLALVLSSGLPNQSALDIARSLLADGMTALARRDWVAHRKVRGIGDAKASRLAAAFELGRRAVAETAADGDPIRDPETLARLLIPKYGHLVQEVLGAVYLDSRNRILREREIFRGTVNSATVATRDVFRFALDEHAASIIVFHNHPSSSPEPSREDIAFTARLAEAGRVLAIEVSDHLILGASAYVSLKERRLM